jgi:hypothetical protein
MSTEQFVEIDRKSIKDALAKFEKTQVDPDWAIPRLIADAMTVGFNAIRDIGMFNGFSRQGLYMQSIQMDAIGKGRNREGEIRNAAKDPRTGYKYPEGLETGTPPHTIRATVAKALHFFLPDGTEIFAKEIQHPGTEPMWIYRQASQIINKRLPSIAANIMKRAMQNG